ncbi:ABC transporter ATP-binding protein [Allobacillus sp. SKP2-8]|uniref:ABC transporter ATP-binding protein n=1 Tax=unclassified Allobacillus TaxID=2628859 RepID=UPI001183F65E|nr:ABC transporter ATP-binding protein [Allobacillus sp. SKP2-8]TSJ68010.1 ABC transporter ATP-binding protein [Allobacillus sp. SKP2-8]
MNIIEVNHLTKKYGTTEVLKDINLKIYRGEVFGFVGHNGAGKSTFIHTITGITNKSAGSFTIMGISDSQLNNVKKRIGVMPDVSNLYENMKGLNFLRYMGKLAGDKRSKPELKTLMKEVGLEGGEQKKIKSYSFGMKKKISIAQALLGNPDLIILDEPTSGIDPESAINIRDLVIKLKEEGKTIFLTSHNLDEIDKVSDRVGILSDGVIKKLGTPRQLKEGIAAGVTISVRTKPILQKNDIQKLSEKMNTDIIFMETKKDYTLLQVPSEEDLPEVSKEIIQSDVHLYEMKVEERSLEDVFMNA